jgi:hypothetical protein
VPNASFLYLLRGVSPSGVGIGFMSAGGTGVLSGGLHELFDEVQPAEAAAGAIEYRCILIDNVHSSESFVGLKAYLSSNTTSADTTLAIGLDPNGTLDTIPKVATETTAPAGVTFSSPSSVATALALGDLAPGADVIGLWLRRTVTAGAAPLLSDAAVLVITNATS